jgi:hypothetical protein
MSKQKERIGSDPLKELSWIQNTRGEKKQSKHSLKNIHTPEITKSTQKGLNPGWTRATFIVREELLEKLKALAYWEKKQPKILVDEIFSSYLKDKKVKPIPEKKS